jgi:hypothetical protein
MKTITLKMTEQEFDTILHSLRLYQSQRDPLDNAGRMDDEFFYRHPTLSDEDLDAFIESINTDHEIVPEPKPRPVLAKSVKVRQTGCRHCNQDIEGFYPYRKGEWRDRGGNSECPPYEHRGPDGIEIVTPPKGQKHAPIIEVTR